MKFSGKQIAVGVLFIVLFAAFCTNPTQNRIKTDLKQRVYQELKIDTTAQMSNNNIFDFFKSLTQDVGKTMVDKTVEEVIEVQNLYFCSFIKASYRQEQKIIGVGAFQQTFLFINLKEAIATIQQK